MKKYLKIDDNLFENHCIKCGCLYQGIQECPFCQLKKVGVQCPVCKVFYYSPYDGVCPFTDDHQYYGFRGKLKLWVKKIRGK